MFSVSVQVEAMQPLYNICMYWTSCYVRIFFFVNWLLSKKKQDLNKDELTATNVTNPTNLCWEALKGKNVCKFRLVTFTVFIVALTAARLTSNFWPYRVGNENLNSVIIPFMIPFMITLNLRIMTTHRHLNPMARIPQ